MKTFGQEKFFPTWQSLPWDSGGYDPTSVVWSMVQSDLDLDHDGKKEFLITTSWSGDYYNVVYLYENTGNDSFNIVWSYSFYPYSNDFSCVTTGDLNNNGREEILCLVDPYDTTYHGFYVFEWDGTDNGFPAIPTTTWNMNLPRGFDEGTAILVDDFDHDGRQEVAVSFIESFDSYKSKVMIFSSISSTFSDSTWNIEFIDSTTFPVVGYAMLSTDLDKDGRKELIVTGWDTLRVAIYENTGSANSYSLAANIKNISPYVDLSNMGLAEANFDNDGTNELYLLTANGAFFVATNNGNVSSMTNANFTWIGQYDYYNGMIGLTKADLDKDSIPEFYLAGSYNEAVYQCKYNSGSVTDYNSYNYSTIYMDDTTDDHTSGYDQGYFRPSKIATGDFDNDGNPDMIVSSASFAGDKPVLMMLEEKNSTSIAVNGGWNIISLPVSVTNSLKTAIFPSAISNAYSFGESGYSGQSNLTNGVGYWLKFPADESLHVAGETLFIDTISVREGWNMIGSSSVPLPLSEITSLPPDNISSNYFEYSSGYSTKDTLQPGKGYWIKVKQDGKIIFPHLSSTITSYSGLTTKRHETVVHKKTSQLERRTR